MGGMTAVFASPPEPGTKPNYPFREWLNGQQWVLTRGRDFWGSSDALIRSLQASARARRLRVTCTTDDAGHVYVRASFWNADGKTDA